MVEWILGLVSQPPVISLLIGFALGYGMRALMSRRRRAVLRKRYYEKQPEHRQ
jgi:hypothetical protein